MTHGSGNRLRIRRASLGTEETVPARILETLPEGEAFDQVLVTVRAEAIAQVLRQVSRVQASAVGTLDPGPRASGRAGLSRPLRPGPPAARPLGTARSVVAARRGQAR